MSEELKNQYGEVESFDSEENIYGLESLFRDLKKRNIDLHQQQAFLVSYCDGSVTACALSPIYNDPNNLSLVGHSLDIIKVEEGELTYETIGIYDTGGKNITQEHGGEGPYYLDHYAGLLRATISQANKPEGVNHVNVLGVTEQTTFSIIWHLGSNSPSDNTL